MADVEVQHPPAEPAPAFPDYMTDADAVLKDKDAKWRYGRAPDYSKTRTVFAQTKKMNHAAGSLPSLVENLVKNWEIEASFKPELSDWRTIDQSNYSFAINGGPPQTAEHMLKVGTYNAIITANDYYDPENSDFSSSHKTFKRMMPTFAWEVLEVYSGPPQVAFRWRHWGTMKNDYVGFNDKGEKITAKAHGGSIDIEGVSVALVDDKLRIQKIETWFDPMDMFRQIAPNGVVNRQIVDKKVSRSDAMDDATTKEARPHNDPSEESTPNKQEDLDKTIDTSLKEGIEHVKVEDNTGLADKFAKTSVDSVPPGTLPGPTANTTTESYMATDQQSSLQDRVDEFLDRPADEIHPHPKDMEKAVKPDAGEAVVVPPQNEEVRSTHEEMSRVTPMECPFMNRE